MHYVEGTPIKEGVTTTNSDTPRNPDQEHFDKMMLNELVWKLDREVWAHVPNPECREEDQWTTSKAREETKKLLIEYLGNSDELKAILLQKEKEIEKLRQLLHDHNGMCQQKLSEQLDEVLPEISDLKKENQELRVEIKRLMVEKQNL